MDWVKRAPGMAHALDKEHVGEFYRYGPHLLQVNRVETDQEALAVHATHGHYQLSDLAVPLVLSRITRAESVQQ